MSKVKFKKLIIYLTSIILVTLCISFTICLVEIKKQKNVSGCIGFRPKEDITISDLEGMNVSGNDILMFINKIKDSDKLQDEINIRVNYLDGTSDDFCGSDLTEFDEIERKINPLSIFGINVDSTKSDPNYIAFTQLTL